MSKTLYSEFQKWSKPSDFTHTKGGNKWNQLKFEVTTDVQEESKEGDIFKKNFAVQSLPTLRRDEQLSKSKVRNTYFVGKEGRGKIKKINNLTPTKRKLISSKQVSKLVPVFDSTSVRPVYSPELFGISESPAKK